MSKLPLRLLKDLGVLTRIERAGDGQGGFSKVWMEKGIIRYRARPATPSEVNEANQERSDVTHFAYFRDTEDVRKDDRLAGIFTLELISKVAPSEHEHHQKWTAKEIQHGR